MCPVVYDACINTNSRSVKLLTCRLGVNIESSRELNCAYKIIVFHYSMNV